MKLTKDSKIFIICPANFHTGGPTLLHQLGARLLSDGLDVYMYYWPQNAVEKVHPLYKHYALPIANDIEDASRNILIIPETLTGLVPNKMEIQCVLWWLSVDNWLATGKDFLRNYEAQNEPLDAKALPNLWMLGNPQISHWVQSEYAKRFLLINGIDEKNILPVGDYLDEVFLSSNKTLLKAGRKNIVAFNPKKGWGFTRKIIEQSLDLAWRPVENMTPEQVEEFLHSAKVYVDFGNHPGKDRIPREAVLAGCCLITGRRGAAANSVDIPIPEDFKFADTEENIPAIVARIRQILADYDRETDRLADYREKILREPELFKQQVRAALGYQMKEAAELILTHNAGGGTEVFLQEYMQGNPGRRRLVMRPDQELKGKGDWKNFVREHNIDYIMVNHLLGFSWDNVLSILPELSVPYSFYLHDYLCICPNWSLDCLAAYCGAYRTHSYCCAIFRERNIPGFDLLEYRRRFEEFLMRADKVIAPTFYAAKIVNSLYPKVNITVQPHKLWENTERTFNPLFVRQELLTLTFLGTFCAQKGARYVLRLNEWRKRRCLSIRLVVIGEDAGDVEGDREGIVFSGRYERGMVPELLAQYQTSVALIPSTFPETYCYTASEAILAGYPVITMNLGAHALRVQQADCGWVLDRDVPDRGQLAMQQLIRRFFTTEGHEEILAKAANTRHFQNGME